VVIAKRSKKDKGDRNVNSEQFMGYMRRLGTLIMFLGIAGIVIGIVLSFLTQVQYSVIVWGLLAVVGHILRTQLPKSSGV